MRTRVPGVMDNFRYSNSVIARTATDFYFHGIPAGVVSRVSDVAKPALFHDLDFKIPVLNCEPISELPAAVTGNLGPPVLNDIMSGVPAICGSGERPTLRSAMSAFGLDPGRAAGREAIPDR